jgi:hypothetical protein
MNYGIARYALIAGRQEPSDKAELVTQLLFGERYTLLDENKKWYLVRNECDAYTCWIDKKLHSPLNPEQWEALTQLPQRRCGDAVGFLEERGGRRFPVPCSALFPGYDGGKFSLPLPDGRLNTYLYDGRIARHDDESPMRHAMRLLHAPYLWGGKSAFGIDCSGLVQVVYQCAGYYMPRDAWQQAELGQTIDFIDLARPGDLVFFDNEEGRIIHVGILTAPGRIIHASGSVRIDKIDHEGIYNEELQAYTHKMRIIKRAEKNSGS